MKTVINIKADKKLKEQAVETAREMGLPLGTIINAFLRNLIYQKEITFRAPFKPSPKLQKVLRLVDKDIEHGRNLSPVFTSVDELMADLRS